MPSIHSLREILAGLTDEGVFGDVQFDSLSQNDEARKGLQYSSTVRFVTICVKDELKGGDAKEIPLVVKSQLVDEDKRAALVNSDGMFTNEVNMYLRLIPKLGAERCGVFPKCYYGRAEGWMNSRGDILVLDDLKGQGFRVPEQNVFLDLPHLILALRKLGEFHGLSYKFKQINKNSDALKNKLIMTKYSKKWLKKIEHFLVFSTRKYGKALMEQGYDEFQFDRLLHKYGDMEGLFKFIAEPEEPFAVVCHGDFNRNNLLFKYDAGRPIQIKVFDLQNSFYTDPILDLGFFLYMNVDADLRRKYWNELLNTYWGGVIASAPLPGFTRSEFFDNFQKKAFLGFVEPAFFLPYMIADGEGLSETMTMSNEEQLRHLEGTGGLKAYEAVCDILKHLVETQAVQNILELTE